MLKRVCLSVLASLVLLFGIVPNTVFASCALQGQARCNLTQCTSGGQQYCCSDQSDCSALQAGTLQSGTTTANNPSTTNNSSTTGTWYSEDFKSWASKVYDQSNPSDIFGERYTAAQVEWVIYSLFAFMFKGMPVVGNLTLCLLSNTNPASCPTQDIINQLKQIQDQANKQGGYQNIQSQSLASLVFATDRPISGIGYVKDKLQNFSLVPVANAETPGFGYTTALKPIQGFWSAVRNVSYGLFVLVAIIFAFLIMFRVKLSPQTVITVQSTIPKIIIALITATFSYAIAGFLVDFMYIVIGLFSVIFANIFATTPTIVQILVNIPTDPSFYFSLMTSGPLNTGILGILMIGGVFFFLPIILILTIGGAIAAIATEGLGGIIALIVIAIIVIIYLWIAIKIIWTLVKTLATFLLTVIFSPLTLTLGALVPNFSFGSWVKNIISQLSVFVTAGVLVTLSLLFGVESLAIVVQTFSQDWLKNLAGLFLSLVFPGIGGFAASAGGLFSNTPGWPPMLNMGGGYAAAFLMWAVSFVLFTMIPKSAELIQSFIQGKPFAYGTAIGEVFGPITGAYGYASRSAAYRSFSEFLGARQGAAILDSRAVQQLLKSPLGRAIGRAMGTNLSESAESIAEKMRERGAA